MTKNGNLQRVSTIEVHSILFRSRSHGPFIFWKLPGVAVVLEKRAGSRVPGSGNEGHGGVGRAREW